MKTPRWICATCRQPFTRRWNANRHCNNKHFGRIKNIISFTEYMTKITNSSIVLNCSSYEDKNSYPHPINVKKQLLFFDNQISANNNNLPLNTIADPFDVFLDRELSSYKLLEQLGPKYEEMRHVLDCVPEPTRTKLLGNALSSAINSNNPIETMNKKLTDLRKAKSNVMMLNDLASYYGIDKASTKEFLKLKSKYKQKQYHQFNK
jgi:hypothetical protein